MYFKLICISMFIVAVLLPSRSLAADWRDCKTVSDVCSMYGSRVSGLLAALNLDYPGLEEVKSAANAGNQVLACQKLISYYKNGSGWQDRYRTSTGSYSQTSANSVLGDSYMFQSVTGTIPRNSDGGLKWDYLGPNSDKEFGYFLNRHGNWSNLLYTYLGTSDTKYGDFLDNLIRDWTTHNPKPSSNSITVIWRVLEAGLRMGTVWPQLFYRFIETSRFTDAGIILMLSGLADHGAYVRSYHITHHNHASMELRGLVNVALSFPEFAASSSWYDHCTTGMLNEINYQFYPDGVQKELTAHYHRVSLREFDAYSEICGWAGKTINSTLLGKREAAWNYLAGSLRPTGRSPLNNDSDLDDNTATLTAMSAEFNRPDWEYIATNGSQGTAPFGLPSAIFPWAGQLVSRSGYDANAHWSFFDAGPWGLGHQHSDKLHLSVTVYGRDILVDAGRYYYIRDAWRNDYFQHSRGHNVIMVDGRGHKDDVKTVSTPLTEYRLQDKFDFIINNTGSLIPSAIHTRAAVYVRGKYWVVFDRIEATGSHTLNPLWHFHPDCAVQAEGQSVKSTDANKGNVRIKPISSLPWTVSLVEGQTSPEIQGWYSVSYNNKEASTCAVYSAVTTASRMFAWLIYPAKGTVPDPSVQVLSETGGVLQVRINDGTQVDMAVNLTGGTAPITMADGSRFTGRCGITGLGAQPLVACGTLLSVNDTVPPSINRVTTTGVTQVQVTFDEWVDSATATNKANYTIDNGVSVSSARLESDAMTVTLITSPLAKGIDYTLTVSGIKDRAATPNTMSTVQETFTYIVCNLSNTTWQAFGMAVQSGTFDVSYDATPLSSTCNGLVALSRGSAADWADCAVLVRFNNQGKLDARNGGVYQADADISYSVNTTYHFRLTVNIPAHTYSVYLTPTGGAEVTLAANYAFRTEQNTVSSLDTWNLIDDTGQTRVCELEVHDPVAVRYSLPAVRRLVRSGSYPDRVRMYTLTGKPADHREAECSGIFIIENKTGGSVEYLSVLILR